MRFGHLSRDSVAAMTPWLALLAIYLIWGTTFGSMRFIVADHFSPGLLVFWRFLISGLLMLGIAKAMGSPWPTRQDFLAHAKIGAIMYFGGNTLIAWALQYVPSGLAATLVATNPFWMTGLAAIIPPREQTHPLVYGGLILGFIGLVILVSPRLDPSDHATTPMFWWSLLGILIMTFFWALGAILARKQHTSDGLMMRLGIQTLTGSLCTLLLQVLVFHKTQIFYPISSHSAWAMAYLIVFGTILGSACYLVTLERLPIAISSTFAYVTPVVSVIVGILFLHETMTPVTWLGTAVILSGVIWVQWAGRQPPSLNQKARAT